MTPVKISIAASIASLLLLLIVFELIRGRRLKERYALLWIVTGLVLLVLSAWRGGLNTIAGWFGVSTYPPAILFAVATLFVIVVLLYYSTVLSQAGRPEHDPRAGGRAARGAARRARITRVSRGWVVVGSGAAVVFAALAFVHAPAEIRVSPFDRYGTAVVRGDVPYHDFSLEYPPARCRRSSCRRSCPRVSYEAAFRGLEALIGCCLLFCLAYLLRDLRPP